MIPVHAARWVLHSFSAPTWAAKLPIDSPASSHPWSVDTSARKVCMTVGSIPTPGLRMTPPHGFPSNIVPSIASLLSLPPPELGAEDVAAFSTSSWDFPSNPARSNFCGQPGGKGQPPKPLQGRQYPTLIGVASHMYHGGYLPRQIRSIGGVDHLNRLRN